jgi:hypothetical protein
VQSEPFDFRKCGPPLGVRADVSGATAQHINEIVPPRNRAYRIRYVYDFSLLFTPWGSTWVGCFA